MKYKIDFGFDVKNKQESIFEKKMSSIIFTKAILTLKTQFMQRYSLGGSTYHVMVGMVLSKKEKNIP